MPVLIVVPARVGSTRLPDKPLQLLGGSPLVSRVVDRARSVPGIDAVVVATDSDRVAAALADREVDVVMTDPELASGTDRTAAVSQSPRFAGFDIVVNLQGDEPFMPIAAVVGAIERVQGGDDIGTAAAPLAPDQVDDPSRVKVVSAGDGRAMYFSRSPIPAVRDAADREAARWWQHIGVYAFRREALLRLAALPPTLLEQTERLEQLRALEAGMSIGVAHLHHAVPPGIDTPADLAAAEARWPDFAEACP